MNNNKTIISIIIPFYKGSKYIEKILENVDNNYQYIISMGEKNLKLELVIVNDSPEEKIVYNKELYKSFKIIIENNVINSGIHQSRVNGLKKSNGQFVLFLDQDDNIEKSFCYSQIKKIGNADIIIANAIDELENGERIWFENKKKQEMSTKKKFYINIGNMIRSPGQCLIRKDSIPEEWKHYILKNNGADDLMLWLMLFENKKIFTINEDILYRHKYLGSNYSLDYKKMRRSEEEILQVSKKSEILKEKDIKSYLRVSYLRNTLIGGEFLDKIKAVLLNLDKIFWIFITKVSTQY